MEPDDLQAMVEAARMASAVAAARTAAAARRTRELRLAGRGRVDSS